MKSIRAKVKGGRVEFTGIPLLIPPGHLKPNALFVKFSQ
jgi:hypothetical protein